MILHYFAHFYNNMTTKYLILLQKVIKTPHIGFERAKESQRTQINARQVELIFGHEMKGCELKLGAFGS